MHTDSAIRKYLCRQKVATFAPKAVLFDMDGVLLHSMQNHAFAWVEAMKSYGISMTEHDAYMTEGQRGIDTIRQMVLLQQGKEIEVAEAQRMYDEKARIFHSLPEAPIMPGIIPLMQLIKAEGLAISIVTGSGQRLLIDRLTTDFSPYVTEEKIVTAYDVTRGKPDPEPYLAGMKKCGVLPTETIVVENAPLGVRAGEASGAFTIAVNTGPLPDSVLLDEGADLLFHDINALYQAFPDIIHQSKQ